MAKPSVNVFNTVVNACEICGEEELTLVVLNAMKKTHGTEGNLITLNIALKRLAKQHNNLACEGLIISMLKNGMEPNVVTYTTAIAACAGEPKNSQAAYEWLKRMRSRRVKPNYHTYNTALASCLDGTLESTRVGSQIADEMLVDVSSEMVEGLKGKADLKSVLPDTYTRLLAIQLGKQLRENWRIGDIDIEDAKATLRVPLLKLVDFNKSEVAKEANEMDKEIKAAMKADEPKSEEEGVSEKVSQDEETLEYSVAKSTHRIAEV